MDRSAPRPGAPARLRAFVRETRAAAALELGIGMAALMAVSAALFAVYSWIETNAAVPRIAVTMADYISREEAPDGEQLDALAEYLWKTDLGGVKNEQAQAEAKPAAAFVIAAIRRMPGDETPTVCWTDTIAFGDAALTAELAAESIGHGAEAQAPGEDFDFAMDEGETVFVTTLCTQPAILPTGFADAVCHFHARQTRHPGEPPAKPLRQAADDSTPDPSSCTT